MENLTGTIIELIGKKELELEFMSPASFRYYKEEEKPLLATAIRRKKIKIRSVGLGVPFDFRVAIDTNGKEYHEDYFRIKDSDELRRLLEGETSRITSRGLAIKADSFDANPEDFPMLIIDEKESQVYGSILNKLHQIRSPNNPLRYYSYGGM